MGIYTASQSPAGKTRLHRHQHPIECTDSIRVAIRRASMHRLIQFKMNNCICFLVHHSPTHFCHVSAFDQERPLHLENISYLRRSRHKMTGLWGTILYNPLKGPVGPTCCPVRTIRCIYRLCTISLPIRSVRFSGAPPTLQALAPIAARALYHPKCPHRSVEGLRGSSALPSLNPHFTLAFALFLKFITPSIIATFSRLFGFLKGISNDQLELLDPPNSNN